MTAKRVQEIWLGADDAWRVWVKQALFSAVTDTSETSAEERPTWLTEDLSWLELGPLVADAYRERTTVAPARVAVLVDLPGEAAIEMGLALGHAGWRPVLAINATSADEEVIDMKPVLRGLERGARAPSSIRSGAGLAPVFILDARREAAGARLPPGAFDNRWTIFASDLPSARHLKAEGLERVVIINDGSDMQEDILVISSAYERAGMDVRVASTSEKRVRTFSGVHPGWLGATLARVRRRFALRRSWDGSYGHRVPIPPAPSHG